MKSTIFRGPLFHFLAGAICGVCSEYESLHLLRVYVQGLNVMYLGVYV